ncbi:hypothetical protein LCGC14_2915620 [marine sediment metagenome]|uniref:Uncharacterized protein n=1 Tax=marine sediment metagenome TaxID=412755 RepID=A0A0F8XQL1_9ZZZZ
MTKESKFYRFYNPCLRHPYSCLDEQKDMCEYCLKIKEAEQKQASEEVDNER